MADAAVFEIFFVYKWSNKHIYVNTWFSFTDPFKVTL